jgi:hypothetical protein
MMNHTFITDNIEHNLNVKTKHFYNRQKNIIVDLDSDTFINHLKCKSYSLIKAHIIETTPIKIVFKQNNNDVVFFSTQKTLALSRYFSDIIYQFEFKSIPFLSYDGYERVHEIIMPDEMDHIAFMHILKWMRVQLYTIPEEYYDAAVLYGCVSDNIRSFTKFFDEIKTIPISENNNSEKNGIPIFSENSKRITNFTVSSDLQKIKNNANIRVYKYTISRTHDVHSKPFIIMEPKYLHQKAQLDDILEIKLFGGGTIIGRKKIDTIVHDIYLNMPNYKPIYEKYIKEGVLYLPLFFSIFYNNYLPVIALQYHTIEIEIHTTGRTEYNVYMRNYSVYLDLEERRRFASCSHEYLISDYNTITLYTNNKPNNIQKIIISIDSIYALIIKTDTPIKYAHLYDEQKRLISFTDTITSKIDFKSRNYKNIPENYYIIPFCLKNPNNYEPSGNINLDKCELVIKFYSTVSSEKIIIGYYSMNILRIISGMLGLGYKNVYGQIMMTSQ